jgi:hypothetical protein
MSRRKRDPAAPAEHEPIDLPAYDRRALDRLHTSAKNWAWRARGGDARARSIARVQAALAWAATHNDEEALGALEAAAKRVLDDVRDRCELNLDPFSPTTAAAYERLLAAVERQLTVDEMGSLDTESRRRAASWFVIVARNSGLSLPALPSDDDRAVEMLVSALRGLRRSVFSDAQEAAESWVRCMAAAAGRTDAVNAAKHRQKKRPSSTGRAPGTTSSTVRDSASGFSLRR